jgi:beta-galactosidase
LSKSIATDELILGVCYYPEQWPEAMWDDDLSRMVEMGFGVIRVGEFCWTMFEPEEGVFDFSFFQRVMDKAHGHGLSVILGTPTATPPAWLTHKYPEVLNARRDGVRLTHGQRRHYNYNTAIYRELAERIAWKMAEAYHAHPALIGWQIDNELNCEIAEFYSEADHTAFREWLEAKYRELDALNHAWGAVFWSQTYTDWEQVRLTGPTPSYSPNPHQALDEKRFWSDSVVSFTELQTRAIRTHDKTHFITTQGGQEHVDYHRLTGAALDFLSFDSYPAFAFIYPDKGETPLLDRRFGLSLSEIRDVSPNFCVMEQQTGPISWLNRIEQPTPKPGQLRLWTYQSIAHGADAIVYFRWRTAAFGTEIYAHGINDHHNVPNRRCEEAKRVGEEVKKLSGLAGSKYVADVAILRDYDGFWDGELDNWHGPYERQSVRAWFAALQYLHVPVDVRYVTAETTLEELSQYHCLIYPHPAILTDRTADLLKAFTDAGGTVVFGCRSGYKDENGHCPMRPYPGPIADLCAVTVQDFTRVLDHEEPKVHFMDAGYLRTGGFLELLKPAGSTVLARHGEGAGHFASSPALVWNAWGMGSAYYFGSVFNQATATALAYRIGLEAAASDLVVLPQEIELAVRESDTARFVFLLNFSGEAQGVEFRRPAVDLLTGAELTSESRLEGYGVWVIKTDR